jgi:hypothetical protein
VEDGRLETSVVAEASDIEYVEFWPAATVAKGRFACAGCGYQLTVLYVLPRCPICREGLWERAEWTPFSRS